MTDGDTLVKFWKGFVPDTTKNNTQWAVRTLEAWRNRTIQDDPVPGDLLTSCDAVARNKWFSLFVIEVRKQDGSSFPISTLAKGEEPRISIDNCKNCTINVTIHK